MYSMAFLSISTFGNLWLVLPAALVHRFNTSNASLTYESRNTNQSHPSQWPELHSIYFSQASAFAQCCRFPTIDRNTFLFARFARPCQAWPFCLTIWFTRSGLKDVLLMMFNRWPCRWWSHHFTRFIFNRISTVLTHLTFAHRSIHKRVLVTRSPLFRIELEFLPFQFGFCRKFWSTRLTLLLQPAISIGIFIVARIVIVCRPYTRIRCIN